MREWALDQWPEGSQVSLERELPRLKVEIRLEREREEMEALERETLAEMERDDMTVKLAVTEHRGRHQEILRLSK
jgi:hypothetical protein